MFEPEKVRVSSDWTDEDRKRICRAMQEYIADLEGRIKALERSGLDTQEERANIMLKALGIQNMVGAVQIQSAELLEAHRDVFARFLLEE